MAERILTADLKPGMVVSSQRTSSYVYSFGTDLTTAKTFVMKGKAIVIQSMTKVRLKTKRWKYDPVTKRNVCKDSFTTKNMVLLSHYKHGLVMYFAHNSEDRKWYLVKEKAPNA